MTKLDWFDDAVKAIEAARALPKFPGEQSPIHAIFDKLVNKLWSQCYNGEPVGTDGCTVCRAWRTEKAEERLAEAIAAVQHGVKTVADLSHVVEDLKGQRGHLLDDLQQTAQDFLGASEQAASAVDAAHRAEKDRLYALGERSELEQHLKGSQATIAEAQTRAEQAERKLAKLTKAIEEGLQ